MKTNNPKAKIFIWKFISIFHCTIYHYQKAKKKVLKLLRVLIDRVLFGFHSDRILFRFLSDKAILKVLINMVLFESSVIDSSSGASVVDSSLLDHQCSFSGMPQLFYQNVPLLLFN